MNLGLKAFKDVQKTNNPAFILQTELTYLIQERELYKPDKLALSSINRGISDLSDALRAVDTVKNATAYKYAETTYLTRADSRLRKEKQLPNDGFHKACSSHISRLKNIMKNPSMLKEERELVEQRKINTETAQASYRELQKQALGL